MKQPVTSLPDLNLARKSMAAGDFSAAFEMAKEHLAHRAEDQDALYIAAVCARYLQDYKSAKSYLETLKQATPDFGRAFQEEGHLLAAQGQSQAALLAYKMATQFNPALTASWAAQAKLAADTGRQNEAAMATAQLQRLNEMPKELLAVTNHLHEGRILQGEKIVRAFLQKQPHHIEAMRLLADIGTKLGVHEDAEFLLGSAIELDPENIQLRIDYIQVLRKRQKYEDALLQAEALLQKDQDSPVFQSLYAIESMQAGNYDTALEMFDRVLVALPRDASTLTSKGHALKTYGRTEDAITSYQAALKASPSHGDAWYALANLKTYKFSSQEIETMQEVQKNPDLALMARIHIAFALGKAFEDKKNAEAAFENYHLGNQLKRKQTRYTTAQMQEEFAAQKKYCDAALFKKQAKLGCAAPDPIFILGLPRAGSTLIEQILASHSQVDGTLELPNILSLAHKLRGHKHITDRDRYPRILHDLSADELCQLGEDYIQNTKTHRDGAAFFTDKMPNNFRHIGLIKLILPNAKIIDARRNALDCCWSGYKQLFAEGQEFTYNLEDIGHYYKAYLDLMDHWQKVLPKQSILQVDHEDVLDDLEGQVRRLLDYCQLPFEQSCLDFYKTTRAVRTASSEQVRQPISKSGVGQWRPFEAHLQPLKEALGPALIS